MKKSHELIKNTVIFFIGKICTQFISIILLPLYTSVLTNSEYGIVDLITTYIVLAVPLITLQIEMAVFRFLIDERDNENKKNIIIFNSFFVVSVITLFISAIIVVISNFIYIEYIIYILFMIIATEYSNLSLQVARGNGDNVNYVKASIWAGFINLICNVIFLLALKIGIVGVFISSIFSNIVCFVYLLVKEKIYLTVKKSNYNKELIFEMLSYSLPLVPNSVIWWVINASDRTIISVFLGNGKNGIYSVSNKFSGIISSIYNIFNMSWTESVSKYIDDDKDMFLSKTFNEIIKFCSSVCLILISSMFIIFRIMIKGDYGESYIYIPILIIASVFNIIVSNLSAIYIAKKKTKEIAKTSFIAGVLNIVINFALIKYIEIYAAAISTLLSFMFVAIYRMIDVKKYIIIKYDKNLYAFIMLLFVVTSFVYYINNFMLNIIWLFIVSIIAIILNKEYVYNVKIKIMEYMKNKVL